MPICTPQVCDDLYAELEFVQDAIEAQQLAIDASYTFTAGLQEGLLGLEGVRDAVMMEISACECEEMQARIVAAKAADKSPERQKRVKAMLSAALRKGYRLIRELI